MKKITPLLFILILLSVCLSSCTNGKAKTETALIPLPVSVNWTGNSFQLNSKTKIEISDSVQAIQPVANYLQHRLQLPTGYPLAIEKNKKKSANSIFLKLSPNTKLGKEGYKLNVDSKDIQISANTTTGLFWGIQTLIQLLPPDIEASSLKTIDKWTVIGANITDYPRFSYRGVMLDVARHFYSVADVKQYIDMAAAYKFNILHLHLSDDQGWRIEIKAFPNLTKKGGQTAVGGGSGGFYTQNDYKEIVNYAASRQICVIPEIDMPGHTNAALASYPKLNCNNKAPKLYTGIDVGFSSFCTDKEYTYEFIDKVIGELASLTPGPYIHIGGDESHATAEKDYIAFIKRIATIVKKHHKRLIGWEEIAKAPIDSSAIAQYWDKKSNIELAVKKKMKVIFSPASKIYLDMKYDSVCPLGLHWAGYVSVDSAYNWDPSTALKSINDQQILGIEAPVWTETLSNMHDLEYMVFPKLPGIAEIGWSPKNKRHWSTYKSRLAEFGKRFTIEGINFYRSPDIPWQINSATSDKK